MRRGPQNKRFFRTPGASARLLVPQRYHTQAARIEAELPKTPTNKIQKVELRKEGVTAQTWDREAAGIRVKREKLSTH